MLFVLNIFIWIFTEYMYQKIEMGMILDYIQKKKIRVHRHYRDNLQLQCWRPGSLSNIKNLFQDHKMQRKELYSKCNRSGTCFHLFIHSAECLYIILVRSEHVKNQFVNIFIPMAFEWNFFSYGTVNLPKGTE